MFLGHYEHALDDKGRLTIPAKFRPGLQKGLVITRGLDNCLLVFPEEAWHVLAGQVSDASLTNLVNPHWRRARRHFFATAEYLIPDQNGRIVLPAGLRKAVGIDGSVVLVGSYNYIELWSPEAWRTESAEVEKSRGNRGFWKAFLNGAGGAQE